MDPPFDVNNQTQYWDRVAPAKIFSHPPDYHWLEPFVGPESPILDLGCGYGRLTVELARRGYTAVIGADSSAGMVSRAMQEHPGLDFRMLPPGDLPFADSSFQAVILFAVLTCIPGDEALRGLVAEIGRVLRPGGVLYVSDYCLQPDARNIERYVRDQPRFGTYGVFALPDGGVVRHFDPQWLASLLAAYTLLNRRELDIATMNGNPARATQMLLRKPEA